ncbi:MAG: GMC family oxidoreductase [Cyanobacteria bacterium P01_D01_bin.44]
MQIFDNQKVENGEQVAVEGKVVFDEATYAFQEVIEADTTRLFDADASPEFTAIKRGETFKVIFQTNQYAPSNGVTLRNEHDGWAKDIYGTYAFGAWIFDLERSSYQDGLKFKFFLNGQYWMEGSEFTVDNLGEHRFTDDSGLNPNTGHALVVFPATTETRFLHSYDNLQTFESPQQQKRFPGNRQETKEYDVIVIGSGMGGGIVADALSDSGLDTLVLEIGGLQSPTHVGNAYADWDEIVSEHQVGHYDRKDGTNFLFGAQMALGGRSLYWSGIILRMQGWEYDYWPDSIWSFLANQEQGGKGGYTRAEYLMRKRKTLGKFQDRVVQHLKQQLPDLNIEDLPRSRHQPNLDDQAMTDSVLFSSTGVFSTADLLSDSKAFTGDVGSRNLTVNLNHLVTHIRPDPANPGRVSEVVCQDLLGNRERVYRGKAVVLAAGSIESPKIFLQSGLNDPSGKAGHGLTDHPYLFSSNYLIPADNPFAGDLNHAKLLLWAGDAQKDHYPFYTEMLINPWYWHVRRADDDLWQRQPPENRRTEITLKFGFSKELIDSNTVETQGPNQKAAIRVANLTLDGKFIDQARQFRNRILGALGIPHDPNQGMGLAPHGGTVNHAGGTLRISEDSSQGVVDENLKCHGYDNLYVADVSVFPYIPTANPSLTLGALALRLSDHLKARFSAG